jgi:hypothetical protein
MEFARTLKMTLATAAGLMGLVTLPPMTIAGGTTSQMYLICASARLCAMRASIEAWTIAVIIFTALFQSQRDPDAKRPMANGIPGQRTLRSRHSRLVLAIRE